jgi:hypothetical protein
MKTYDVTIEAKVRKTYRVQAKNEDKAVEEAHQCFRVVCDGTEEKYEQDTIEVTNIRGVK